MADVINRTTLEYRASAHSPDFPEPVWKWNPDMSAVVGVPARYWKAPADWDAPSAGPVVMTQVEKDAVDTAALDAQRDETTSRIDDVEDVLRAALKTILDELNAHALTINAILDAADNASNLQGFKSDMAAIADYPQRTVAQLRATIRNKLGG